MFDVASLDRPIAEDFHGDEKVVVLARCGKVIEAAFEFGMRELGELALEVEAIIGGAVGGQLLQELMPALASAASNVDIGALIGQVAGGGAGGAILTVLAGVMKWMVVPPKST